MIKKSILVLFMLLSCSLSFSQIKGGKLIGPTTISNYSLTVNCSVKPYRVFIDGREISGNRINLPAGNHSVVVQAQGFWDYKSNININRDMVINAQLTRMIQNARVSVYIPGNNIGPNGNRDIRIYDNGMLLSGFSFELTPGEHRIRIESGAFVMETIYNFEQGRTYTIKPVMYLGIE